MPIVEFDGDYAKLSSWLRREYNDAISARRTYDRLLDEWDRQYEQVPRVARKTFPWDGASNLEVPVGASHVDTIDSRIETGYFASQPHVLVESHNSKYVEHARALQDYMNDISLPTSHYRQEKAVEILATVKLGTAFQWLSYEANTKRVAVAPGKLVDVSVHEGPIQRFIHPRHLIAPPDARSIETARWISIRQYETWGEVIHAKNRRMYNTAPVEDVEGKGTFSTVDTRREARQGIRRGNSPRVWENPITFCLYQEDDWKEPIDLWVNWHAPSGIIYKAFYNPFDHMQWPLARSVYMLRESAFYGIGIMGMASMIQEEITTIHNYCLDNLLAANTVVALMKQNTVKSLDIAPMAAIEYTGDKDSIRFERIGQALSGQQVGEAVANGYLEKRTGASEGNVNRMAPQRGLSSSRTPATTTLALLGESNKRFELAIENSKQADSRLLWQHAMLLRQYWDRQKQQADVWDEKKSRLITELFQREPSVLRQFLVINVSASSATMNKEVEKQNILTLGGYMREYYGLFLQFVKLQSEAPALQPIISKILTGIYTFAERMLHTFDIKDPERFLFKPDDIGQLNAQQPQQQADEYAQMFITGALNGADNNGVVAQR